MKTDRELLELAAKAAEIPYIVPAEGYSGHLGLMAGSENPMRCSTWSPLTDDGDALRLAVKLGILVDVARFATTAIANGDIHAAEKHNGDPYAATRRAIVRAAAAIGDCGDGENSARKTSG